jgi:hypothetical protein
MVLRSQRDCADVSCSTVQFPMISDYKVVREDILSDKGKSTVGPSVAWAIRG